MASNIVRLLTLELRNDPEDSRRLELIHALRLLISAHSGQAQAPIIMQILLDELKTPPFYLCYGFQILEGIAEVACHFDTSEGPRLISDLINAWPQIYDWIWRGAYLLDVPLDTSVVPETISDYCSATTNILSLYSSHPALLAISAENECTTAFLLVARLWYLKVKGFDAPISASTASISSLCRTYLDIKNSIHTPDENCLSFGVQPAIPSMGHFFEWLTTQEPVSLNAPISSTIGLLLRTPNTEFTAIHPDLDSVEAHLGMIVALSRAPRHTYVFINHRSHIIVCETLVFLSKLSTKNSASTLVAKCVDLCAEHLCLILEKSIGFQPILGALDAMLLPLLVKCYSRTPQLFDTESHAASLLTHTLSKYLIYSSVRDHVSKSFETVAASGSEALLVPESPFAAAWANFKTLATQRMQVQERPFRLKHEIVCGNTTCRTSKARADLSSCSGCLRAFYCTKACQRYDWKYGGHKEKCISPSVAYPDRKNFPISTRDLRSTDEVLRQDLALHLSEIRAAWNTQRSQGAPVIVFDYTTFPPGFRTTSVAGHRHKRTTERHDVFWEETVAMVDGARQRGLAQGIVVIDLPAGVTFYSTAAMATLEELEHTIGAAGPLFGPGATMCVA
ncbi:hypothetical protein C8R43DRAFT_448806 [Mycena crocata]|nr:hypothetical protein C8R43DRAFT_448806 [Mycena crocata]